MTNFVRSFPLLDISIRSDGDGRTVEAYAAVWDTPVDIADQQGRYREQIARTAFDRTIAHRGDKPWPVIFNHGMTIHGTPSPLDSMPIGASIERPRPDARGLVTVARYHAGERADAALEAIRSGAISAQSFSGRFIGSDPAVPRGGFRPDQRTGDLPLVTRTEISMNEFGPAVFAAYPTAAITGVRTEDIATQIRELTPDELAELARMFATATPLDDVETDPAEVPDTTSDEVPVADGSLEQHPARPHMSQRTREILAAMRNEVES